MRIAICFSGAIRNFHTCIPSIQKYLLNNLNADIFLHLWSYQIDPSNPLDINFKWQQSNLNSHFENEIINILKPKSFVIDKYNHEWEEKIVSIIDTDQSIDPKEKNYAYSCCGMYFKILQSYLLAKKYADLHNITYDLIIRARLDFIWEKPININDFIDINSKIVVLIKDRYAHFSKLITNDKFFAGNSEVMEYLSSIYLYLNQYQKEGITIEGQTVIEKHIQKRGLNVKWIGDKDTYYKCMPRHCIKNINRNIYINILYDNTMLLNEIAFYLLFAGYNLFVNKNDLVANYLRSFTGFNYYSTERDSDVIFDYIIVDNNSDSDFKSEYKCKIGINLSEKSDIIIKINYDIINDNIIHFNRFIYALISNNIQNTEYTFDNLLLINEIPENEKIIYKYHDHGYYPSEYIGKAMNNKHNILFNNREISVDRREFYIKYIYNFYNCKSMPY